jgi:hypothetical protein
MSREVSEMEEYALVVDGDRLYGRTCDAVREYLEEAQHQGIHHMAPLDDTQTVMGILGYHDHMFPEEVIVPGGAMVVDILTLCN